VQLLTGVPEQDLGVVRVGAVRGQEVVKVERERRSGQPLTGAAALRLTGVAPARVEREVVEEEVEPARLAVADLDRVGGHRRDDDRARDRAHAAGDEPRAQSFA
jgi:hypothetical protein